MSSQRSAEHDPVCVALEAGDGVTDQMFARAYETAHWLNLATTLPTEPHLRHRRCPTLF